jgi:hypothetical protein
MKLATLLALWLEIGILKIIHGIKVFCPTNLALIEISGNAYGMHML